MFSREGRVRLFLAALILVLVLVNSQSLQVSYQSRTILAELFASSARERTASLAAKLLERLPAEDVSELTLWMEEEARRRGLRSACLLDWNARLVTGGSCAPARGEAFDRLDRDGRRELVELGWSMTAVEPAYEPEAASAAGYYVLSHPTPSETSPGVLRVEVPAERIAEANRRFRATVVYQVSALSLVLLAVVLFLNSLLAPQRRLVAEARSVASELSGESPASAKASARGPEEKDEGQFLLATFQDVVARLKEKERELQALHRLEKARADETEALASDIIRSMTTGLVSLDPSGAVVLVNPAAERIFGIEAARVERRPFEEAFPGASELVERTEAALGEGAHHLRGRAVYRTADGRTLHLGTSVLPLLTAEGRPRGALLLLADLTEVVELRERLLLKDNLARLGEMVAGIAHEFRNGLATILGNAKLLKETRTEEAGELVEALLEEASSLARVVSEFLQFARPEPLALAPVALDELVSELVEELRPRAEASGVTLSLESESVRLEADEALLRKAFSNLIVNAIESAGNGSGARVWLELGREGGGTALLRVRDDGPGVPDENRGKLFTPFFTSKAQGTGLGLSVVQKIVVSHNGSVELEESKEGASFAVRLPLEKEASQPPEAWV